MPVSATVPCPVDGCDGQVDIEVKLKVKSAEAGHKPGTRLDVSADGITLTGDHMRQSHPDLKIPASLRGE